MHNGGCRLGAGAGSRASGTWLPPLASPASVGGAGTSEALLTPQRPGVRMTSSIQVASVPVGVLEDFGEVGAW